MIDNKDDNHHHPLWSWSKAVYHTVGRSTSLTSVVIIQIKITILIIIVWFPPDTWKVALSPAATWMAATPPPPSTKAPSPSCSSSSSTSQSTKFTKATKSLWCYSSSTSSFTSTWDDRNIGSKKVPPEYLSPRNILFTTWPKPAV